MVYFVGAGSGAVDLITVRGQRLLRQADVVIYAGSLVNPQLLKETRPDCRLYNSAKMTLEEVLDRAQAALVRDLDRAYICRSGDTHYRIPIANILYFVSDRRQVACVTAGREYTFYGKLDTVAAEVGADFVRIHQRYLVRTGAVDRMEGGEVVLRDGRRLPVSRSCQPSALLAFTRAELEG